jgi:CheY-like chemotaxis protein
MDAYSFSLIKLSALVLSPDAYAYPTDVSMPVMDGLTSTGQIRTHEREDSLPRTRIVALTCFSSAEYQRDALLSGIDIFLIKPVPMKTLQPILEMDPEVVDVPG